MGIHDIHRCRSRNIHSYMHIRVHIQDLHIQWYLSLYRYWIISIDSIDNDFYIYIYIPRIVHRQIEGSTYWSSWSSSPCLNILQVLDTPTRWAHLNLPKLPGGVARLYVGCMEVSINGDWIAQNGWCIMNIPIFAWMMWGYPHFRKVPDIVEQNFKSSVVSLYTALFLLKLPASSW